MVRDTDGMPEKFCLTCQRKLVLESQYSIPRFVQGNPDTSVGLHNQHYWEEQKQKRAAAIAANKVGYMGERQFCNQTCAAFYGRAAARSLGPLSNGAIQNALLDYPWVTKRREAVSKKHKQSGA